MPTITANGNAAYVVVDYTVSSNDTTATIAINSIKAYRRPSTSTTITGLRVYVSFPSYSDTNLYYNSGNISISSNPTNITPSLATKTFNKAKTSSTLVLTCTFTKSTNTSYETEKVSPSARASLTVPSKTSYTVTYASNVMTLSDTAQTKWYGEDLELKGSVQYSGYTFLGWNTEEDWSGTKYAAGASYSDNAPLTLYAMLAMNPKVTKGDAYRCEYSSPAVVSDEGQYAAVSFTLSRSEVITRCQYAAAVYSDAECTQLISGTSVSGSYSSAQEGSGASIVSLNITKLLASSTSATKLNTDSKYYVKITSSGKYSNDGTLVDTTSSIYIDEVPEAFFTMDVKAGGHGIAFGGPSNENAFVNYFKSKFLADVMFETMTGTIQMFGGTTPPNGWLLCDGSYVSKATYSKLWDVIGYTYGSANSVPDGYFALPDLRGRMPIGPMDCSWVKNASNKNLIIDGYRISYVTDAYLAYILPTWKDLTVNTTYTIQLWDVLIRNSGKDETNIGVDVFWGGGTVKLAEWLGESYFSPLPNFWHTTKTDTEGLMMYYAPYLEATFTTGSTAGANPGQLNIYNSMPNVTAVRFLRVGRFQLTEGTHPKEPFVPYPQYRNKPLGSTGGETSPGLSLDNLPSHTHTIAHTHRLTSSLQQAWVAKAGTGATEPGSAISGSGKYYAAANATGYNWIDTTAGSNTANSGSTGGSINPDQMPPYTAVNFIICTGVLS